MFDESADKSSARLRTLGGIYAGRFSSYYVKEPRCARRASIGRTDRFFFFYRRCGLSLRLRVVRAGSAGLFRWPPGSLFSPAPRSAPVGGSLVAGAPCIQSTSGCRPILSGRPEIGAFSPFFVSVRPAGRGRSVRPRGATGSRRSRFRAVSAPGDPRRRFRGSGAAPHA